jgi:hypothetical protein
LPPNDSCAAWMSGIERWQVGQSSLTKQSSAGRPEGNERGALAESFSVKAGSVAIREV